MVELSNKLAERYQELESGVPLEQSKVGVWIEGIGLITPNPTAMDPTEDGVTGNEIIEALREFQLGLSAKYHLPTQQVAGIIATVASQMLTADM